MPRVEDPDVILEQRVQEGFGLSCSPVGTQGGHVPAAGLRPAYVSIAAGGYGMLLSRFPGG